MQVYLFDIMPWPYRQAEIPHPFPGYMYDRSLGKELYDRLATMAETFERLVVEVDVRVLDVVLRE